MADRVVINAVAVPDAYADVTAAVTWTASHVANKNRTPLTGREILFCRNAGVTGRAVKISSSPDEMNRTNDVDLTLGNGEYKVFPFFKTPGWIQTDKHLWFEGAHADVEWAVLRLP